MQTRRQDDWEFNTDDEKWEMGKHGDDVLESLTYDSPDEFDVHDYTEVAEKDRVELMNPPLEFCPILDSSTNPSKNIQTWNREKLWCGKKWVEKFWGLLIDLFKCWKKF